MKSRPKKIPSLKPQLAVFRWAGWLVVLMIVVWLWQAQRVTTIVCRVGMQPCPPATVAILATVKQKPLLFLDVVAQTENELQAKTGYKIVSVTRELPDTLKIYIIPQKPLFALVNETVAAAWMVSGEGQVYEGSPSAELQLPVIHIPPEITTLLQEQTPLDASLVRFLSEVAEGVRDTKIAAERIDLTGNQEIVIYLPSHQRATIDADEPYLQLKRLKLLLQAQEQAQLPEGVTTFEVRYRLPVLRKE